MQPYMIKPNEGKAVWFLNTLVTYKADKGTTSGQFGLIEQLLPPGFEPPNHVHHREDEAFYVLDGQITFYCNNEIFEAKSGSFMFLPKELPHGFKVSNSGTARVLQLNTPGGFEMFHEDMGEPAITRTLPQPAEPDLDKLFQLAEKYGFDLILKKTEV